MSRVKQRLLTLAIILPLGVAIINAQSTTAGIRGTVTDVTGAIVPGATIEVTNINTNIVSAASTNTSGTYQFPSLPPGKYTVLGKATGLQSQRYNDVTLETGARINLDFSLKVASVETEVQVTAAMEQLKETSSTVGGVIPNQKLTELPLADLSALNMQATIGGVSGGNFAGTQSTSTNISRDGISIIGERLGGTAIFTGVNIVDEIKVVVSPADAEFSRGAGQVIISTKSGGNDFHGVVFGTLRNEALNANDFFSNMRGIRRATLKRSQFGAGIGGPIKRNKTFFYFLYDAQRQSAAQTITSTTLTALARQGQFRYFPGVRNGNSIAAVPTVDSAGNPITSAAATGPLQTFSVFGRDAARLTPDSTGVVTKALSYQPLPNDFTTGDGLNTAGYTWNRKTPNNRDQFNIRIDHNFNDRWKLTGSYVIEDILTNYSNVNFPIKNGRSEQKNHVWTGKLTTVISPTMVNEFTYGGKYSFNDSGPAAFWHPEELYYPKSANGEDYNVTYATTTQLINGGLAHFVQNNGISEWHDALTYIRGTHTVKAGVNYTSPYAGVIDPGGANGNTVPTLVLGAGGVPVTGVTSALIPGLGQNQALAQNLLTDLTGSVARATQVLNINSPTDKAFLPYVLRDRKFYSTQASWFVKDDWKVTPSLTLNLGVRWDYYGVPYEAKGLTAALIGGSKSIFGISGTDWSAINNPNATGGSLMREELIGKNSPNPGKLPYANDLNNFGPAIGLSWSLPYFGKDKTVLRMGYSVTYPQATTLGQVDSVIGSTPGVNTGAIFQSASSVNIANMVLPLQPVITPLGINPLTDRTGAQVTYDSGTRSPYIQSWNVSIDRQLPGKLVVSGRYIGNKGTKLIRGINVNSNNIFENGLLDAFLVTQQGGNAPLFDRIFNGLNIGTGVVNGTTLTGSQALRGSSATSPFFANNSPGALANFINSTASFTGVPGGLLRNGGLTENFIVASPQFATANLFGNYGNSTYHSAQLEVNRRFASGWSIYANYTFSKALGEAAGNGSSNYSNPRYWRNDKSRLSFDQTHALKMNGTYELPFGTGKAFLSGGGVLSSIFGAWQTGGVLSLTSGSPMTFTAGGTTSFTQNASNAVLLGALPTNGEPVKTGNGVLYYPGQTQANEPGIAQITTAQGLAATSTMLGIKDSSGKFLFVNPRPGTLGMGNFMVNGPIQFGLDMNLIKKIRIAEKVSTELRFDAIDVLNRPRWGNPNTNINNVNFGRITTASGSRILVANLRIVF